MVEKLIAKVHIDENKEYNFHLLPFNGVIGCAHNLEKTKENIKGLLELYLKSIGEMGFSSRKEVEQKMGREWTDLTLNKFLKVYQGTNGEVLELRDLKGPNYLPKDYDVKICYV